MTNNNQHIDDDAVDHFAAAMKKKLAAARAKGRAGWHECDAGVLSGMLRHHVDNGDPLDVANFCMFLWSLGQGIASAPATSAQPESCADCGKTSTKDSMWALYCVECIETKIAPALTIEQATVLVSIAQPAVVLVPVDPPAAALPILIGYDTLEHLNDCDQEVLLTRARFRWNQLLAAGISALAAAQGNPS